MHKMFEIEEVGELCPNCGADKIAQDPAAASMLGLRSPLGIAVCSDCEYRWQSPRPTEKTMLEFYEAAYFSNEDNTSGSQLLKEYPLPAHATRRYSSDACVYMQKQHLWQISEIAKRLGKTEGKLLEIGCGRGGFLANAEAAGFDAYGILITNEPQPT
jgi:hypothetical protein